MEHIFNANLEGADDFYVTVGSDQCMDFFPINTSSCFTNLLYRDLRLPKFEVGLAEIYLNVPDQPITNDDVTEEPPTVIEQVIETPPNKFFQLPGVDNLITGSRLRTTQIKFAKKQNSLTNFFTELTSMLDKRRQPVNVIFKQLFKAPGDGPYTVLTFIDPSKSFTMRIPEIWANVFGFTVTDFAPGEFISERKWSELEFSLIEMQSALTIRLYTWEALQLPVNEPDEYEIDAVIHECLTTLIAADVLVRMPILPDPLDDTFTRQQLHVYIDISDVQFTLPVSVNKMLKLRENYSFRNPITVIEIPETDVPIVPDDIIIVPVVPHIYGQNIVISTNIIEPSYYGSTTKPVIRRFPKNAIKSSDYVVFQPVYYHSLKYTDLKQINISISDEFNHIVQKSDSPTIVLLHFKRKS